MLLLVLGDNYLVLYVGWRGGPASYLLIGVLAVQGELGGGRGEKACFHLVNRSVTPGLQPLAIFLISPMFRHVSSHRVVQYGWLGRERRGHCARAAAG